MIFLHVALKDDILTIEGWVQDKYLYSLNLKILNFIIFFNGTLWACK